MVTQSRRTHLKTARKLSLFVLPWVLCLSMVSSALGHGQPPPPIGTFVKNEEGVRIIVKDQNLVDVVYAVERASGIKIRVAGHLDPEKITADIHEPDWSSAIQNLFAEYSTIEIGKNPLLKVHIIGLKGDPTAVIQRTPADLKDIQVKNGFVYRPVKRIKKKIWAKEPIPYTRSQLEWVVGEDFHAPLPVEMLGDPAFEALLKKYNVETKEDLGRFNKARAVRREAGKMLRVLQKREYLKR